MPATVNGATWESGHEAYPNVFSPYCPHAVFLVRGIVTCKQLELALGVPQLLIESNLTSSRQVTSEIA